MASKCHVCGKPMATDISVDQTIDAVIPLDSEYGGQCRVCGRQCCEDHIDDDKVCSVCREEA